MITGDIHTAEDLTRLRLSLMELRAGAEKVEALGHVPGIDWRKHTAAVAAQATARAVELGLEPADAPAGGRL